MKLTGADRRIWASVMAAGAAMTLCFAARSAGTASLRRIPWEPPATVREQGEDLVNINTAGLEELMALPGIGPARAQAILDDREANGPYRYPENLIRVRGIGEGVLGDILEHITTGGEDHAQNSGG